MTNLEICKALDYIYLDKEMNVDNEFPVMWKDDSNRRDDKRRYLRCWWNFLNLLENMLCTQDSKEEQGQIIHSVYYAKI